MIAAKKQLWITDLNLWTIIKTTGYLLALPSYHSTDHVKADLFQFVFISCSFSCVWLAKILLRLSHYLNNIDLSLKSVALEMFRIYLIYISTFFWQRSKYFLGTLIGNSYCTRNIMFFLSDNLVLFYCFFTDFFFFFIGLIVLICPMCEFHWCTVYQSSKYYHLNSFLRMPDMPSDMFLLPWNDDIIEDNGRTYEVYVSLIISWMVVSADIVIVYWRFIDTLIIGLYKMN